MKLRLVFHLLTALLLVTLTESASAKSDSLKMAKKAQKEQQKAERRRQHEIKRPAQPHFKGGDIDKFEAWVEANLKFDFGSLPRDTPHIYVEVPFYVEADGSTSLSDEDTPSKKLHPRLVFEIERVIQFSPDWEPGHDLFGNPVRSRQVLSLTLYNHHSTAPAAPARPARRIRR